MTLETPWQIEQTWGSNQAVLKGVLEVLQPHTAIECGCGNFSTQLLRAHVSQLITIEHDLPWAKKIQKRFPESPNHLWVLHPLPANNSTDPTSMEEQDRRLLHEFYEESAKTLPHYDFLFVDTYRCARVPAALALAPQTDLLLIHDVRPSSREFYHYHLLDGMLADWFRYEHRPEGMINKIHAIPWTALYSKFLIDLNRIQGPIIQESERLWGMGVGLEKIDG